MGWYRARSNSCHCSLASKLPCQVILLQYKVFPLHNEGACKWSPHMATICTLLHYFYTISVAHTFVMAIGYTAHNHHKNMRAKGDDVSGLGERLSYRIKSNERSTLEGV